MEKDPKPGLFYTGLFFALIMENGEKKEEKKIKLSAEEELFCRLFVQGGGFAGKCAKCYKEAFGDESQKAWLNARKVFDRPQVKARIRELLQEIDAETEEIAVKLQIAETLKAIMEETAEAAYTDKFGIDLSPAPLRAVSVNAAKALMEIYPVRHAGQAKGKSEGGAGITFNVIVPAAVQVTKERGNDEGE